MIRNKRRLFFYTFCSLCVVSSLIFLSRLENVSKNHVRLQNAYLDPEVITPQESQNDTLHQEKYKAKTIEPLGKRNPLWKDYSTILIHGESKQGIDPNRTFAARRKFVRGMMMDAWGNYERYAWGENELRPISKSSEGGVFGNLRMGTTIVDAIDTLYIMGLTKEYTKARNWIEEKLDFENVKISLPLFETNIRYLGGLLSIYALTGDEMFKEKAYTLGKKLLPAFDTPSGIPYSKVNKGNPLSVLSEVGSLHLEFVYLSDITGDPIFRDKVVKIRKVLRQNKKSKGLYSNYINVNDGSFSQEGEVSLGPMGDSFYEYLIKSYIQTGDLDARDMYFEAIDAIEKNELFRRSKSGLVYVAEMKKGRHVYQMSHLACFSGGMFALGSVIDASSSRLGQLEYFDRSRFQRARRHMQIAEGITNTCHESYIRADTGLGPESFHFKAHREAEALSTDDRGYILRPEVIESYFVLWRLSGNPKYREWGWQAARAIQDYCKVGVLGGYSGITNVYDKNSVKDDIQQSFFLAETLKYLYLLFSSKELISLDQWVFNTEAHPLPIKDVNPYYERNKLQRQK